MQRDLLYLTTSSLPSYYVQQIFMEIHDAVREWKKIWDEMKDYPFFDDEDSIIKVFENEIENDFELKALREIIKKRFDNILEKSFAKLLTVIIIFAVTIILSFANAYIVPLQQKSWLIKQQINEQRIQEYNDKKE